MPSLQGLDVHPKLGSIKCNLPVKRNGRCQQSPSFVEGRGLKEAKPSRPVPLHALLCKGQQLPPAEQYALDCRHFRIILRNLEAVR